MLQISSNSMKFNHILMLDVIIGEFGNVVYKDTFF